MKKKFLLGFVVISIGLHAQQQDSLVTPYGVFETTAFDTLEQYSGYDHACLTTDDGGTSDYIEIVSSSRMCSPVVKEHDELISIYPNPTATNAIIHLSNIDSVNTITILDAFGRVAYYTTGALIINNEIVIPSATWAQGLYSIRIETASKVITEKLEVL